MNKDFCPNKNSKEFKELSEIFGEDKAYFLWMRNKGNPLDKAPNWADSKLFKDLLNWFEGDRIAALNAKSNIYTNEFFNWFGDWIEALNIRNNKGRSGLFSEMENEALEKINPDFVAYNNALRKLAIKLGRVPMLNEINPAELLKEAGLDKYVTTEYFAVDVKEDVQFDLSSNYADAQMDLVDLKKKYPDLNLEFNTFSLPNEQGEKFIKNFMKQDLSQGIYDELAILNSVSKVVDENGEPLVLYNGNPDENITIFKEGKGKYNNKPLYYFTPNKRQALSYATQGNSERDPNDYLIIGFNVDVNSEEAKYADFKSIKEFEESTSNEGKIYPVFLNLRNPIVDVSPEYIHDDTLLKPENDGMISVAFSDNIGKNDKVSIAKQYVVRNSNQIKHIENRDGKYTGPNIYHNVTLQEVFNQLKIKAENVVIKNKEMSLAQFNAKYGTNLRYADKFKTRLRIFDNDSLWGIPVRTENDKKINVANEINTSALRYYLLDKFGIKILVINDEEYDKTITENKASSCCIKGNTMYIRYSRNDKLNNVQYIEEFLHPAIHLLYKNNRLLADKLIEQAKDLFPDLCKLIKYIYASRGIDVVNEEIITQILSKYLNREISENGENSRNIIDYIYTFIKELLKQFSDLFGELDIKLIKDQKKIVVSGKDIRDVLGYDLLALLINSKQIIFRDILELNEVRLNAIDSDNSSISSTILSNEFNDLLSKTSNDGRLHSTAIEHAINNTREAFVQRLISKYLEGHKDASAVDIYGVRIGSSVDWDQAAVDRIISDQQEKMAKIFGLEKKELPSGGFIYTSADKSKDSRLRVAFVNSITGNDWTDEDGTVHKGMFEEGTKGEEAAWNAIYLSLEAGDATTFTHEMAHYYVRTFWESQAVQDALKEVDKTLGRKKNEENLKYSQRLEEKLVEWLTDKTMKDSEKKVSFYEKISNLLHNFGKLINEDSNTRNNILDSLHAAFSINQDLADRVAEIIYFEKYIGPAHQNLTTRLSDLVDEIDGTTFWKIKATLESREKSERSRGKSDNYDLLNIRAHLQKIQKRSITQKDDVAATVSDFLLLADQDIERAIKVLSNIMLDPDGISKLDISDFMHLKTDVVGYYDIMLSGTIDEYLRSSKTISEDLRKQLIEQRDNILPNINILKNAFDRILRQYVDQKIEEYADELVTVGDKDIFITNMKLWARNQIGEGKLMFAENALGPAVISRSPIVRLVEYLVTAQNRISYESALKVGHELMDRYKKCASIGKKIMSINFMKQFCELDDDGNPTGYFAREWNYGKLYKKRDELIAKLIKKYDLNYDTDTNQIQFDDRDTYIKYMTDFYNEMDKIANFRYKKEYYIERAKILSPKALDKQRRIQRQIDTLLAKATDKELGVPMLFNLSRDEMDQLESLRKEKLNLANPYVFVYNVDGSISHMEEKAGEDLEIAKEFIRWNAWKSGKVRYKSNFDKFNEVRLKIVDKYGDNSYQVKLFDYRYKVRKISPAFYDLIWTEGDDDGVLTLKNDPELQELYARRSAIRNSIMSRQGFYQPNLKKLNDEAFAELKRIDEEIAARSGGKTNFNKIATKPFVGEYDDAGNLTANPVYNYFTEAERAAASASGGYVGDSKYTYITASGKVSPLSIFKYTKPNDADMIEDVLLGEYSELDLDSELVNRNFDDSLQEDLLPKKTDEFKNKNWEKIQANAQLKSFYDAILQTMEEAYSLLPNFDASKMKYIMPLMRDRDAKLIFRNRHLLTNMGASIADAFTITETDTKYNESFSERADGSIVETIPIRWVSKIKDPSIICTDIVKSVTLFYEMALNYKNKAEVNPMLLAMLFLVQGGYSSQSSTKGPSEQANRIEKFLLMYVYGRTRTGFDSKKPMDRNAKRVSLITDTILSKAHAKLMSHNWRAVLKNFIDSFLTDMGEILSGKYITVKDALWANAEMAKELFSTTNSFGRANNKSKISALMQLNGVSGGISEIFGQHNETWLRRIISKHFAMGEYTLVDYTFKGHLTAAIYHSIRLVKNPITKELEFMTKDQAMFHYHDAGLNMEDGVKAWKNSKITLWDAYDVDKQGNAVVNSRYTKYVFPKVKSTGRESRRLVNLVHGIIRERSSVVNGILDQSGNAAWKQNVAGALILLMRGWMITQMWDNLKDGHDFAEYERQWRQVIDSEEEQPISIPGPNGSIKSLKKKKSEDKKEDEVKILSKNGIENIIRKEDAEYRGQYNFETGTVEHGQWRGLFTAYRHSIKDLINRISAFYKHSRILENSKTLTRNERYKLRRLNTMAATFIIICGLTYITTFAKVKWPDEDSIVKKLLEILNAANISVVSERASQIPFFAPLSILDIVNSLVISKTLIEDADKFVHLLLDLIEMVEDKIFDGDEDYKYDDEIKSGAYKELNVWQRDAMKVESYIFPDFSVDNVFRSLSKSGNEASINYYINNVSPTKQAVGAAEAVVPWAASWFGTDLSMPEKSSGKSSRGRGGRSSSSNSRNF